MLWFHASALPACLSPYWTTGDISFSLLWLHQLTKTNPNGHSWKKVSQVWVCLYSIRSVHPLINHSEPSVSSLLFFWLDHICTYKVAAGVHSTQTDGRRKLHLCQVLQNITVPALLWYYHKMSHSHLLCAHICARAPLCKVTASQRLFEGKQACRSLSGWRCRGHVSVCRRPRCLQLIPVKSHHGCSVKIWAGSGQACAWIWV